MNTVHFVMSDAFAGIEQHVDELLSNNLLKILFLYVMSLLHITLIRTLKFSKLKIMEEDL